MKCKPHNAYTFTYIVSPLLELRRWDFRLVSSVRGLEAVGEYVDLHIIGRSKVFDLFPRTYKGKNRCVLWKKHALINSRERPLKSDINLEQSSHVETCVLLSKLDTCKRIEVKTEVELDYEVSSKIKSIAPIRKDDVYGGYRVKMDAVF